jgi:hypothetical protein
MIKGAAMEVVDSAIEEEEVDHLALTAEAVVAIAEALDVVHIQMYLDSEWGADEAKDNQ